MNFFLRWSFAFVAKQKPRLECNGVISAHYHLCLLGSINSSASVSQVAGTTGVHHHTQLIFVFLVEIELYHVAQVGLELLTSSDPPASASQCAGITGMSHRIPPYSFFPTTFVPINYPHSSPPPHSPSQPLVIILLLSISMSSIQDLDFGL